MTAIDDSAWKTILTEARTHGAWTDRAVDDATLRQLYELLRLAPTALNSQPVRVVFVKSAEAKERLKPGLIEGNVEKTMAAPVTAIIAFDTAYQEKLGQLFPHWPGAQDLVAGMPPEAREGMGRLNAGLQAGYLITTARGLGLDCGPMSGFDPAAVDAAFFADGAWKSVLLVNLGYGDASKLFPRSPRLDFDEACRIA